MQTALKVINESSGCSDASKDRFVNHVLPRVYASGFANTLMAKDVNLYLQAVEAQKLPDDLGRVTAQIWADFADAQGGADFTRIYTFIAGSQLSQSAPD